MTTVRSCFPFNTVERTSAGDVDVLHTDIRKANGHGSPTAPIFTAQQQQKLHLLPSSRAASWVTNVGLHGFLIMHVS